MKRILLFLALGLFLAPQAVAQDDSVTLTHEQAAKLVQRYQEALAAAAEAQEQAEKARQLAVICLAGWSGIK